MGRQAAGMVFISHKLFGDGASRRGPEPVFWTHVFLFINPLHSISEPEWSGQPILESSSSTLDPPVQSNNLTPASLLHEPSVQDISSSFTSPSCVEAVTSTLGSFTLSDDVFLRTRCYSKKNMMASSASEQTVDSFGENTESSNSSDGIRGVWYYLTSSRDSSEVSLSTTMPQSSTASSSYLTESRDETTASSGSVIELSSDLSRSAEDAEMPLRPANQTHPHTNPEVITLSDSSSCESHLSNTSEEYNHESSTEGNLDEPHPLKSDVKCQKSSLSEEMLHNEAGSATEERGKDLQELKNMDFKTEKGNSGEDNSTRGVTCIYTVT